MLKAEKSLSLPAAPLAAVLLVLTMIAAARGEVALLGVGQTPADAIDLSGLNEVLEDGTPHNRLGAFGSAIDHTGIGARYIAVADRGPADGATRYRCRFHEFEITLPPGQPGPVSIKLARTVMLTNEDGRPLTGIASAFAPDNSERGLRFDPEGVRVGPQGTLFISDEYGPLVAEFGLDGRRRRTLGTPPGFSIARPHADKRRETADNTVGRVVNRGFEGLALTPDGKALFALLQSPLLQDGGRTGVHVRMVRFDLPTNTTAQFIYALDGPALGLNEILAVSGTRFLVIERDSLVGEQARTKKITLIDLADATDVSRIVALPTVSLPVGVHAASKRLFIDLLDSRWGLRGKAFPEKIEGLAWGPSLADGRRVLLVTADNDLKPNAPSWVYAFAVPEADLSIGR